MQAMAAPDRHLWSAWADHLRDRRLRRAFAIGFLILFGFIGTFTYIGFVLAAPPLALSMMATGFVFFVFLPSMITTPLAGPVVTRFGAHRALARWRSLVALAGLGLLVVPSLAAVIAGLVLVGVGTFFGQAVATGYVGRRAQKRPRRRERPLSVLLLWRRPRRRGRWSASCSTAPAGTPPSPASSPRLLSPPGSAAACPKRNENEP